MASQETQTNQTKNAEEAPDDKNVVAVNKKGKGLSELARHLRAIQAKNTKL